MEGPQPISHLVLARLANELNTPLAPMRLQLEMAQGRLPAGEAQLLQRNLDRLASLGRDIVDYCELEAGLCRVDLQEHDVVPLVREHVARAQAKAPGVALRLESEGSLACWMDPGRIARIVDKYLDNAVRHMPDGGQARVVLQAQNGRALVEVHDQGVGFDAADAAHLFAPFAVRPAGGPGRVGGLGLSLHLARRIVELHGGHTWALSPGPGLGATFGFALRAATDRARPTASENHI